MNVNVSVNSSIFGLHQFLWKNIWLFTKGQNIVDIENIISSDFAWGKCLYISINWTYRRSAGSAAGWASLGPRCTGGSSELHSPAESRPSLWCWCPQWQKNSWRQVTQIQGLVCRKLFVRVTVTTGQKRVQTVPTAPFCKCSVIIWCSASFTSPSNFHMMCIPVTDYLFSTDTVHSSDSTVNDLRCRACCWSVLTILCGYKRILCDCVCFQSRSLVLIRADADWRQEDTQQ